MGTIVPDIFLSYNRDDQDRARIFAEALEREGLSVWWDVGLRVGEAYDEVTERALREAKAVVVLWSKKSVSSRWVRAEATLAQRNRTFFPCMIEACERPIMFELTQTADLAHWRGADDDPAWRVFLSDLKRFIAGEITTESEPDRLMGKGKPPFSGFVLDRRVALAAGGGAAAIAAAYFAFRPHWPALAENGVAVLPFRNLSGDAKQDYLCAGLAAEVRSVLARNASLRVVAQASCEAVKQRALAASEMAKELAVSFLLDGNVSFAGDRFKVATELIDGKTGFSKWSESFDHPMAELSLVQDAIAASVTRELAVDIKDPEEGASFGATRDSAAFDDYLKGNELYALATSLDADLSALAHFDRALARDPNFGAAYAAKARSLTSLGNTADNIVKAHLYYESAVEAARRAIEFGPSSADAYSTLGYVLFQAQLKVAEAREPYERSYKLGAGYAPVIARYALYAAATRRFDAAREAIERARELDPLNATIHRGVGFVQYAEGKYEASIQSVTNALSLNPKLSDSHARIAMAKIALGRPDEAIDAAKNEKSGMMRLPAIAIASRRIDDASAADAALAELVSKYGDAGLYQQAQVLSGWGRADEAMTVLKRALELGDSGLTYAYIDPTLDALRGREDFKLLLKSLGFI